MWSRDGRVLTTFKPASKQLQTIIVTLIRWVLFLYKSHSIWTKKDTYSSLFRSIICICQKNVVLLHRKSLIIRNMEAALRQTYDGNTNVSERPLIDPDWRNQHSYTRDEFMNKLSQRLGKHYGLADIREAK